MTDAPLTVLHQDERLLVIDKPPDLLVHPSELAPRDEPNVRDRLQDQLERSVWPIHRLDRATSGVLAMALDAEAASALGQLFQGRAVTKTYLAIVRGWAEADGVIDHPVKDRDAPQRPGKPGLTRYRTLARSEIDAAIETYPQSRFSLVELQPETGRRHQLRRHLKHLSHPIIGDTSYGRGPYNRYFREAGVDRLLLHAWRLQLRHPYSGEMLFLEADLDARFARALKVAALPPPGQDSSGTQRTSS